MAISTFAELTSSAQSWLHRSGETGLSDFIEEFLELAEDRINADFLRAGGIGPMETSSDLTISAQRVNAPTRYAGIRNLYISGDPNKKLDYIPPESFYSKFLSTEAGTPVAFTVEGDQSLSDPFVFVFGPTPSQTFTGKLLYWQRFEPLSDSNTTNWLLSNARGLLLYGILIEAAAFFQKPPVYLLQWSQMYDDLMDQIIGADKTAKYPAGSLVMDSEGVGVV